MTSNSFIDLLEQQKLVPESLAKQLRAKAAQGDDRITPKSILKYLVKKNIVTRDAAKQILETTLIVSDKAESSILGLRPLADEVDEPKPAKRASASKNQPEAPAKPASKPVVPAKPAPAPVETHEPLLAPIDHGGGLHDLGDGDASLLGAEADQDAFEDVTKAGGKSKNKSKKKKRGAKDRGKNKNEWDSPIMLLGGGGLIVLVIAGVILYWLLFRENADAVLKLANEQFEGGSYTQAIANYRKFVEEFPSHKDFSKVKVRLGLAELRKDTEGTTDFAGALETAQRVIDEIEDEDAFVSDGDEEGISQAKRDLSSLLTAIAKGLSQQADAEKDPAVAKERLDQIATALGLLANTKYVPQRLLISSDIAAIRETVDRVQVRQQRDADLAATIEQIDKAVAAGDTAAAFDARRALLSKYSMLADDPTLTAKVLEISAAEKSGVKFTPSDQVAVTTPAPSPVVAELALAERRGNAVAGAEGSVYVRADGGVYALNAADGALLWRRFVGMDGPPPVSLPEGQVVAVDSQANELVCLTADDGKLVWRQPLEGKLAEPVLAGDRLLVASDAGKLYVLQASDGKLAGFVQFGQPLRLPPVVNDRGDRIYLVGEHSSLFTLAADDFRCIGVFYLGHAPGGVAVAPVTVLDKVIVADNSGAETCTLRVLGLDDQGAVAKDIAARRLRGLVVNPLPVVGRRFAAVTTLGEATVFQAAVGDQQKSVTVLAAREPQDREQLARFALLEEGSLWIGGRQLTRLSVAPTSNQMTVQSLDRNFQGDAFDYPMQAAGNAIVHVRRPAGRSGVIVTAMDASANRTAWETDLAVPLAGAPIVDSAGGNIAAGSASGAVFVLDREAMTRRVQDQAARLPGPIAAKPFTDNVDLGQNRLVLGTVESPALIHFRPGDPRQALTAVTLPSPLACAPVAWGDGFVAATAIGQVFLYNADTAAQTAVPFQPELTPGNSYQWIRPAVSNEGDQSQLVISDGVEKIYLLSIVAQPQPHLEATATVDVGPSSLESPLAVVGDRVIAGTASGHLASFALADLAPAEPVDLGGRIVWGPFPAEDGALAALDTEELIFIAADGAVRWRQPLKRGKLGGEPIVADGEAIMLCPAKGLLRVGLADGAESAFVELAQPAVAGPTALGQRLILGAADGALLIVERP
jgi:outer membrane protein assembly factor BamB/tetratricopeptide (TPR) repeat protein